MVVSPKKWPVSVEAVSPFSNWDRSNFFAFEQNETETGIWDRSSETGKYLFQNTPSLPVWTMWKLASISIQIICCTVNFVIITLSSYFNFKQCSQNNEMYLKRRSLSIHYGYNLSILSTIIGIIISCEILLHFNHYPYILGICCAICLHALAIIVDDDVSAICLMGASWWTRITS